MQRRVDWDVVVVGAGPVGSHAARLLALRGYKVLMVEEHPVVGDPVQCAGLVTPRVFDHAPFAVGELWQNDLTGGVVYAPDGRCVQFDAGCVKAVAMDRGGFDRCMADHARLAGVEVRTSCKAVAAHGDSEGVDVTLQDAEGRYVVRTRLVVGADGIRGSVARWFGLPPVREVVSAYEAELSGASIPEGGESLIPMFAGRVQAPGFFSWIIPVGGDRVRAGLAVAPGLSEDAAKRYYQRMFTDPLSAPYLEGTREEHLIIGGIPLGLRERIVEDRVMLVGDAAGMAKPTSGGGIYMGMVAAEHLVEVADGALRRDRLGRGDLLPYEARVRRRVAPELRRGWLMREVFVRFRDEDLNRLAHLLDQPRVVDVIESRGDIDFASRLVWPLLRVEPRLASLFMRVLMRPGGA